MTKDEEQALGVTGGGKFRRVEVRRVLNASIQRVWSAITDADEVAQW